MLWSAIFSTPEVDNSKFGSSKFETSLKIPRLTIPSLRRVQVKTYPMLIENMMFTSPWLNYH